MRSSAITARSAWRTGLAAAASAVALALAGCGSSGGGGGPLQVEASIDTFVAQIGGATTAVAYYEDATTAPWVFYSMANRFAVTKIGMTKDTVAELAAPGYIEKITVLKGYGGKDYALLSMGGKGIGVVDVSNPAAPAYLRTMTVEYLPESYTYSDGGGTVFTEPAATVPLGGGAVHDVLVDDAGTPADTSDDQLFIANGSFGIQKTALATLMDATGDGVLPVASMSARRWTLRYAGENPWGGPVSLKLHGGKLYAALGFLGIGIYDPANLTRTGGYNLYADCANSAQEDWFGYPQRKISCPASSLDPATNVVAGGYGTDASDEAYGMPTYLQAANELGNKNGLTWYPWAEFDRYGKYYYYARTLDLVDLPGGKTMAYVAYSLGGLVAVDVTDPAAPAYEGYVPAVPAHGPDEPPINVDKKGILSHFGSGMLKEAGAMDVRVVDAGGGSYRAYYTDHFAGLVVVSGAEDPAAHWKNGGGNVDNDTDPKVFWPDYEFVKSYDMTPVVVGDESIPKFLTATNGNYTAPVMLATGEINGHGGALFLLPAMNAAAAGQVDAVQSSGAGGVSFVDFVDLTSPNVAVASRFAVPVNLVSTNEVGAKGDGSAGQPIAIGHTEGATVAGNFLYLADGPHGVSVWRIADGTTPIDTLRLVANTLQDEYPDPAFPNVIPTPHAFKVGFGDDPNQAYVMSQSLGMRRIDVSAVNNGTAQVGAPVLLNAFGNVFEHNTEAGSIGDVVGQDHAYGVTFSGKYAIVADGDNGLTVYDTTATPGTAASVVANIGDSADTASGKPPVGRAAAVKLWTDPATRKTYAVVAAGAYGISVVDMTDFLRSGNKADLTKSKLVKTFEPIKSDDDNAFGSADGKSVDVHIVGDIAYFSYDSFGLVAYRMADLIRPANEERPLVVPAGQAPDACAGITDVTKLSAKQGGVAECRPTAVGYFKLQFQPGYEDVEGGALYMTPQFFPANVPYVNASGNVVRSSQPRLLFFVGYGDAGVIKLDWSNVAAPVLVARKEVVGEAVGTAIKNGRVYVPANAGGLTVLK